MKRGGLKAAKKIKGPLLGFTRVFSLAPTPEKFVVKDELSEGRHGRLEIARWSDEFRLWFGDKVEKPAAKSKVKIQRLRRHASDAEIVKELGGKRKAEMTLSEVRVLLMKKRKSRGKWVFLRSMHANIAYVRDINNILRSVDFYWTSSGWALAAGPVQKKGRWEKDRHVVSHKQ